MMTEPAGWFILGNGQKVDRNAYLVELPQRRDYWDVYEIDKYEVTTVQFLKFVMGTYRPPLIDW